MRLSSLVGELNDRKGILLSFILGFTIRLIPEMLSYPYPIGFDTVYYASRIRSGMTWTGWTGAFSTWLLEGIMISVNRIVQANPFLLLKLVVPLLFGLNVCGIYYFSRKALNWSVRTALIAAFFFAFQLASLRVSWDLHNNLLGSAVLLFTLPLVKRAETKKSFAMLLTLSLLLVLSHILVSAALLTVIIAVIAEDWLKHERLKAVKLFVAALPAFAVLLIGLFVLPSTSYVSSLGNVVVSEDSIHQRPGGLFFLVNYLGVADPVQNYPTYIDLALHIISLFSVLYLWWLPLVVVGFFRDKVLGSWTLLLLFGSFNALITPFCALDLWNRWMFMLVYPFTFYAINGVEKLATLGSMRTVLSSRYLTWIRVTRKTVTRIFFATIVLGLILLVLPPFYDRFGVFAIPTTTSYLPSTMLYNSVPLRDVRPTIEVFEWLNDHMTNGSIVLVHRAFLWWADLYLDKKRMILYFERDIEKALEVALERGFHPVYAVWWNENYLTFQGHSFGWYGIIIPKYLKYTFSSDRISVFQYPTD